MKTKLLFIIAFLLIANKVSSQEEKQLASRDGVTVSYQLILENEGKKKDSYILIVNTENTSDTDLYYNVELHKDNNGNWALPILPEQKGFTKIKVRNSTGWFGDGQSLIGEQTDYITTNNSILFKIKKGNIYSEETDFRVKKGNKPLITNTYLRRLKKIEEFDLKISSKMLDGNYISSCGNMQINISSGNSTERGDFLTQTTNGKQFIWLRSTTTTFVRENNSDYSLTYNKNNGTFTYSTSDGITCNWKKE